MRKQEQAQMNWWVQNMQHLPQAPVPHADEGIYRAPSRKENWAPAPGPDS